MTIQPTDFSSLFTFSRGSTAHEFNAAGVLTEVPANVPRRAFNPVTLAPEGWHIDSASILPMRNARLEGAVVGSPGTLPTYWLQANLNVNGIQYEVAGTGYEDGIPYVDVRFFGTATASATRAINLEQVGQCAASDGQVWTFSYFTRVVAGNASTATHQMGIRVYSGGSVLTSGTRVFTVTSAPLRTQRQVITYTLATPTVTSVMPTLYWAWPDGTAVDVTLRIGCPNIVQENYATSPIMPPVGLLSGATRGSDNLHIGPTAFANTFGAVPTQGCVIVDAFLAASTHNSAVRTVFRLDDGSFSQNTVEIRPNSGGNSVLGVSYILTTQATTSGAGTPIYGQIGRYGLRWDRTGAYYVCYNGGAVRHGAVSLKPTFNHLRLGTSGGGAYLNGRISGIWCSHIAPNDAKFAAACTPGADVAAALR